MLLCIDILSFFNEVVLEPAGLLSDHVRCFRYLADILDILKRSTADLVPQLRQCIDDHARLHHTLYPICLKPKYHWLFHIPEHLQQFGVCLSCFAPERKHRMVKSMAAHVFNHYLNKHLSMRIGFETLQAFASSSNLCKECYLDGAVREITDPFVVACLSCITDEIVSVCTAKRTILG